MAIKPIPIQGKNVSFLVIYEQTSFTINSLKINCFDFY